jgi:hypothetical protein
VVHWTPILSSAVTAVFVTLLVEYLAKPRLEARKDRILEGMRARRRPNQTPRSGAAMLTWEATRFSTRGVPA